jgi:hypothetical protein
MWRRESRAESDDEPFQELARCPSEFLMSIEEAFSSSRSVRHQHMALRLRAPTLEQISVSPAHIAFLAMALIYPPVQHPGLRAWGSLGLEAGMCPYGNDMDSELRPSESFLGHRKSLPCRRGLHRLGEGPGPVEEWATQAPRRTHR